MTLTERIEVDREVMLGKPVIRGTRIPVELILRKLSEGASEADLLDAYPRLTRGYRCRQVLRCPQVTCQSAGMDAKKLLAEALRHSDTERAALAVAGRGPRP